MTPCGSPPSRPRSPQATVWEALLFSASLRLDGAHGRAATTHFAAHIMAVVELEDLAHSLVGFPGGFTINHLAPIQFN